jgi:hypothetical protein
MKLGFRYWFSEIISVEVVEDVVVFLALIMGLVHV